MVMFDARYFAFATVAALLVLSPGATMAVVLQMALARSRRAAFATVAGVAIGNSTLALASALGMAAIFAHWPRALGVVTTGGAVYLAWLGFRGLWGAWRSGAARPGIPGPAATPATRAGAQPASPAGRHAGAFATGVVTNLLNPSVIVFYMALLPQFIGPGDPFLLRFLVLAATHVLMALAWLTAYAAMVGTFASWMSRPLTRRIMASVTGLVLIGFSLRLFLR